MEAGHKACTDNHLTPVVADGVTGHVSVASLTLDQLMKAVGVRIRQELRVQSATSYLPNTEVGGSGKSTTPYLLWPSTFAAGQVVALVTLPSPSTSS